MKKLFALPLIAGILFLFSCETDPLVIFPGTWNIDTGGEMHFNADGTGYSINSTSFWLNDGCITADTIPFLWSTTQIGNTSKGTIRLEYLEADWVTPCGNSSSITYLIKSKDQIQLGEQILGVGVVDYLNRK